MTFHYKYQRILEVREVQKKTVESELSATRDLVSEAEQQTKELIQYLESLEQQKLHQQQAGISIQQLQQYNDYQSYMTQQIANAEQKFVQLADQMSATQNILVAATLETKKWDRLKESAHSLFYKEQAHDEQKSADEMAVLRFTQPATR